MGRGEGSIRNTLCCAGRLLLLVWAVAGFKLCEICHFYYKIYIQQISFSSMFHVRSWVRAGFDAGVPETVLTRILDNLQTFKAQEQWEKGEGKKKQILSRMPVDLGLAIGRRAIITNITELDHLSNASLYELRALHRTQA